MSLVWCGGGLSSRTLGDLAAVGDQCLGGADFALWVSGPFPLSSSSLSGSAAPTETFVHPWAGSDHCGVRPVGQGGYQACSSFARLLHPSLCDSKGHRWVAPNHRPLAPEQLCGCLPFSYGDLTGCSSIPSGRGLVGISGSPGCLPSGAGSSIFSPVPQVLSGGVGLPVPCSLFWPFYGSSGLYPHHGPCLRDHASSWVPDPPVPRRLAGPGFHLPGECSGEGLPSLALPASWDLGQPSQELVDTHADSGLSRDYDSNYSFEGFPDPQANPEAFSSAPGLSVHPVSSGVHLEAAIGDHVLDVCSGSRLRMLSLQLRLHVAGRLQVDDYLVDWDSTCHRDLLWWSDVSHLQVGMPLGESLPNLCLFTDSSDTGWVASLGDVHPSGSWSPLSSQFSINHRELRAVWLALRGFLTFLRGCIVAVFSDNTTALACLKKQDGTRSANLNTVAQLVLRFCEEFHITLLPQFIPGKMNVLADSLSRRNQVIGSEWTLCAEVFCQLLHRWPATIDPFATSLNYRLPVYFSPMVDPQSAGTDAMLQSWDSLQAYAFPPFGLLSLVLTKVRQSQGLELTPIARIWPQHLWSPDLLELLVEIPSFLPHRRDLLKQPHFHHYHENLHVLQLTACHISSVPRVIPASLQRWLVNLPSVVDTPLG